MLHSISACWRETPPAQVEQALTAEVKRLLDGGGPTEAETARRLFADLGLDLTSRQLSERVSAVQDARSNLVNVTAEAGTGEEAATIANAVATTVVEDTNATARDEYSRLAEEIAVLDLLSGGRLVTVAGIGYRPEEYALFDVEWRRRGRIQDELLETLLKAWTGEEFEYRGRTVRVTPRPLTDPHPLLLVGGSSKAAARRAARLGLPFFPSAHLPELEAYYKERLVEYGTEGWTMMPTAETPLLHIAENPDEVWGRHGEHFLHEARTYASWQSGDIRSAVRSAATSVDELRAEGVYRILTPDQCVELGLDNLVLHPLAGGMPVTEGWRSLRLFAERVMPTLGG